MEPSDNIREAGRRLARDMRAIRTERRISTDAVIRATKAAPNVVSEFESNALIGNPMYNRVYLRLFVRGYAEVLGIKPDDALAAVDEVMEGRYTDGLARTYLKEYDKAQAVEPEPLPERTEPSKPAKPEIPEDLIEASVPIPPAPPSQESVEDLPGVEVFEPPGSTKTQEKSGSRVPPAAAKPTVAAAERTRGPKVLLPDAGDVAKWIGAVLGAAVVAFAAWYLWPRGVEEASVPQVAQDTTRVQIPVLPPRIVLPDTADFFLIAARDTLNPIRLTAAQALVDSQWYNMGVRTPVWVEFGDTLQVRVTDSLAVELHANDVDVVVAGMTMPVRLQQNGRRFVLYKADVQARLDSLRQARALPTG
ncbi:MAG: helix-turn-helix domain-containing protein [Rhodothermales bacterium]|nr:helix-turn-helix domain-containing protein [Rhodothermales bacterium]MBO6781523.1 helix-turn-helix domain-containing protein [Rhodothermales bacterium]